MTDNKVEIKQALDKLMAHVEQFHLIYSGTQPEFERLIANLMVKTAPQPAQPEQTAPPESALQSLARRCLWIAYCWNDHNFGEAYKYARETAQLHSINNFDDANEWLEVQPEQTSPVRQPLTETALYLLLLGIDPETKRLPPGFKQFARAIEAAHGITTQKDKP